MSNSSERESSMAEAVLREFLEREEAAPGGAVAQSKSERRAQREAAARRERNADWELRRRVSFALANLPARVDGGLVRRAERLILSTRPYDFWKRLSFVRAEHAAGLVAELRDRSELQARFVLAAVGAHAAEPDAEFGEEGLSRLRRAGRALAKIENYTRAPLDAAGAEGVRFVSADECLVQAARAALLAVRDEVEPSAPVLYYWLLVVLAQDASSQSCNALRLLAKHTQVRKVLARILCFYPEQSALDSLRDACAAEIAQLRKPPERGEPVMRQPGQAYRFVPGSAQSFDGWARGRPPGIAPREWPRSRINGVPLRHAFTIKLPAAYRVQGDAVAIAFFHTSEAYDRGKLPIVAKLFAEAQLPVESEADAFLSEVARCAQRRHPRERYFKCVGEFALLWLSEREFEGGPCPLPDLIDPWELETEHPALARDIFEFREEDFEPEWLRLEPYADPNVGFAPEESFWDDDDDDATTETISSGYVDPYSERGEAMGLEALRLGSHWGGTSFASQGIPAGLSAFYLELEHDFGGLNLGGDGMGQLDLLNETWHWACG